MRLFNKHNRRHRQQQGFVLVGALMTMLLLVLVGITATTSSSLEVQIATADRDSKIAFYSAESGVQKTFAKISQSLNDIPPTPISTVLNQISNTEYDRDDARFVFSITSSDSQWKDDGPFSFVSTGQDPNKKATARIKVIFTKSVEPHPDYDKGLLSEQDISISGSSSMNGAMHSNGNFSQTGGGGEILGKITAGMTAAAGSCAPPECEISDNEPTIYIPEITDGVNDTPSDFSYWRNLAQNWPNVYETEDSTYKNELLEDKIVFVEGDVTIQNNAVLRNVTLVATGSVTFHGSTGNEPPTGVSVIAGGDIDYNGASDNFGVFWTNGNFTQNGSSNLDGAVIAHGMISFNGSLTYTYNDEMDTSFLPQVTLLSIANWADQAMLE